MWSPSCTHLHSHTKANTHFCAFCSPFLLFFCSGLEKSDCFCRPTCKFALSLSLFHLGAEKWPLVSKQLCRPGRERGLKKGREEREKIQWTSETLFSASFPFFNSLSLSSSLLSISLFTSPLFSPSLSYFTCPLSLTFCSSSPPICAFPASFILPLSLCS